jgi:UDP-N-acetylglucosamine acyltransferase
MYRETTNKALELIEANITPSQERDHILNFVRNADRGIMKGFRHGNQLNGSSY